LLRGREGEGSLYGAKAPIRQETFQQAFRRTPKVAPRIYLSRVRRFEREMQEREVSLSAVRLVFAKLLTTACGFLSGPEGSILQSGIVTSVRASKKF